MKNSVLTKSVLTVSGLVAIAIGGAILFAPAAFHSANGIHFGGDSSLLSETRAAAGALLATGVLLSFGAFTPRPTFTAATVGAMTYLAYGLSRILSLALDGMPATGIALAGVAELVIGAACVLVLTRTSTSSVRTEPTARLRRGAERTRLT
ncbi:DUF4345 domain-containing protein [Streptomyces sp. NPDC057877]|uniref:DUF4345 domain-containing protein n=1 Tax=Streptomyces sp. NPDC057877 TaxID=3346269 RepID=UPI00367FA58A